MLLSVTTVKDTVDHLRRFVEGNLAGGVDHLIVFLDAPGADGQPQAREYLEAQQRVTVVPAGRGWWGEQRPAELNVRQCINANVAGSVLDQALGPDSWLFHVDGDEVVRLDRAELAALPDSQVSVHLAVREVASQQRWEGVPDLFKRPLGQDQLRTLQERGLIDEPDNRHFLHGHLQGKAGRRVGTPTWLTLHRVVDEEGRVVPADESDRLEVFHFESYDADEFIRKWVTMARSGPIAAFRPGRAALARRIVALVRDDSLSDEALRKELLVLYREHGQDDVEALAALGVLDQVDVRRPVGVLADVDPGLIAALRQGLAAWRGQEKQDFFHGASTRDGRALVQR
jgi:hypothetical protein